MNKILITIYVLKLDEYFDLFIPINLNLKEMIDLIQQTIVELSQNSYTINNNALLYSCDNGDVINFNNIVKYSGLTNGCKVILI